MILKNAAFMDAHFNLSRGDIELEQGRIGRIADELSGRETLDLHDCLLLPGFVDIHIHGCAGFDAGDGTPGALEAMSDFLITKGVTSFCPTLMTLPEAETQRALLSIGQKMSGRLPGARILGAHMEGPFLSKEKKGAQNSSFLRDPDAEVFFRLYERCGGVIKLVDIAPERPGADAFLRAVSTVCTVSIAHTAAGYETAKEAFRQGASHATHLFNAMTGLHHREPGVVGAVFDTADVTAELICDGFHLHPAVLRASFALLGERAVVVSDACRAAGCSDGEYDLGGQTIQVTDGKAYLSDGVIAASTTNMFDSFQNLLRFGIGLSDAVRACTLAPARVVGADSDVGSIEPGKRADLIALDPNHRLVMAMVGGEIRYSR